MGCRFLEGAPQERPPVSGTSLDRPLVSAYVHITFYIHTLLLFTALSKNQAHLIVCQKPAFEVSITACRESPEISRCDGPSWPCRVRLGLMLVGKGSWSGCSP